MKQAKKTQDERNEESMYNLTTSIKGEPHSCYLFFKSSKMYSDDTGYFEECVYELKTQTPEKQAGLYHNFVIKNTLDFDQQLINITTDVYGFQERARMSLIRSFSEKGWNTELDLDTSFIELKKAKLEANFGRGVRFSNISALLISKSSFSSLLRNIFSSLIMATSLLAPSKVSSIVLMKILTLISQSRKEWKIRLTRWRFEDNEIFQSCIDC